MGLTFSLPPLLQVERAGRMIALQVHDAIEAGVDASFAGAAALAAVRHIHNRGIHVRVQMTESGTDNADPCFVLQRSILEAMGIDLRPASRTPTSTPYPCALSGTDHTATLGDSDFLVAQPYLAPDHPLQWDGFRTQDNPFLHKPDAAHVRSVAFVREMDRRALEDVHIPSLCLMENAGIGAVAVAAHMLERLPAGGAICMLVGPGNNGGDALVVARGLIEGGHAVRVLLLADPTSMRGDAKTNLDILSESAANCIEAIPTATRLQDALSGARLVVDGLFGTGLARELTGDALAWVEAVNASGRTVLSLDVPSGLDAETGAVRGACIRANRTVTFAAATPGLLTESGGLCAGRVVVADIGCPRSLLEPKKNLGTMS